MMSSNNLELAISAAVHVGNEIMKIYESDDFGVVTKGDNSPLTKADKVSHKVICEALSFSNLPLLSEERAQMSFEERSSWSSFWMIDPIDDTKEFIKRMVNLLNPFFIIQR